MMEVSIKDLALTNYPFQIEHTEMVDVDGRQRKSTDRTAKGRVSARSGESDVYRVFDVHAYG